MACTLASGRKSSRRSSWAFSATTTVEIDIKIAPTDIGITKPMGASTPAASGTAIRLYPAAHQRFCFIFRYDAFDSCITDSTERGDHARRGDSHIGACTDRDADVRLSQRGCVVDAVPDHRHPQPLFLQR